MGALNPVVSNSLNSMYFTTISHKKVSLEPLRRTPTIHYSLLNVCTSGMLKNFNNWFFGKEKKKPCFVAFTNFCGLNTSDMTILSGHWMQRLEEEFQVTAYSVWGRDANNWLSRTSARWVQYVIVPLKYTSLVMEIQIGSQFGSRGIHSPGPCMIHLASM